METELAEAIAKLESQEVVIKEKDETIAASNELNDLSTAKINSLEDMNNQLKLKVKQITEAAQKFKANNEHLKNEMKKEKAKPKAAKSPKDVDLL